MSALTSGNSVVQLSGNINAAGFAFEVEPAPILAYEILQ